MIQLTPTNILFGIVVLQAIFATYSYFKTPQIKGDQAKIRLEDKVADLEKQILEIKQTHLISIENNIKDLSATVHDLQITIVKLNTILDERLPKQQNVASQ
jgi:hypothetical protein